MSIYIPNMEMPISCEKCPFLDYEEGFCLASAVKGKSGWYESVLCPGSIKDGRHDECPLIPVPEHGRLIDADALVHSYYPAPSFPNLCKAINDAPTIIPADPVKEEPT